MNFCSWVGNHIRSRTGLEQREWGEGDRLSLHSSAIILVTWVQKLKKETSPNTRDVLRNEVLLKEKCLEIMWIYSMPKDILSSIQAFVYCLSYTGTWRTLESIKVRDTWWGTIAHMYINYRQFRDGNQPTVHISELEEENGEHSNTGWRQGSKATH